MSWHYFQWGVARNLIRKWVSSGVAKKCVGTVLGAITRGVPPGRNHCWAFRCFGSDRTPGVAPQGVFRSRTVSTTVAKWFVPVARGTVDNVYRFGPLRDA
jgi:hypothetical protein